MRRDTLCNRFAMRSYLLFLLLMQFGLPALPQARQSSSPVVPSAIKIDKSRLRALPQAMQPKSMVFSTRPEAESKSQRRPLIIDSISPCYVLDIDPEEEEGVFTITTIPPAPNKGIKVYLQQLATTMGLPAVKPNIGLKSDSISVQFLIFKNGWIAALTNTEPNTPTPSHGVILHAIKKNACVWRPALQAGRPVVYLLKMVIYYSRDDKGNILSLDNLYYRPSANIEKKSKPKNSI
ncbi:hypothetical protein [Sphingobacterium sp. IITKGP-BTPF85]|uniref:hypothetical protein n=1 Tax=Sphingobacterium sp. IITKGP-BTPF85 TaxID=1338009 RepID=UPI0018CD10CD|nr:hypothetical protein [Sphingobacterium sp. IITKGP-BTPF85]